MNIVNVALVLLPSFGTNNDFFIPPLGLAYLKGYLKKSHPQLKVDIIDGRCWPQGQNYLSHITTQRPAGELFVSEIQDLPLIVEIIHRFIHKATPKEFLDIPVENESFIQFSIASGLAPNVLMNELKCIHSLASRYASKLTSYDLVGFSVFNSNLYSSILFASIIKRINPEIKVIFGGPQVTQSRVTSDILISSNIVDYIIPGVGEKKLAYLVNLLLDGVNPCGKIITEEFDDGVTHAIPDYESLPLDKYDPFQFPIMASRGCVASCVYCSEHHLFGKLAYKSPLEALVPHKHRDI
ncbi:hypothetical protein SY88_18610 [Clostridiales bacterium PH28_bin88]|nr:hypothetical protein SY88_18610 [Clostridiales bacterium PH28_bin88]